MASPRLPLNIPALSGIFKVSQTEDKMLLKSKYILLIVTLFLCYHPFTPAGAANIYVTPNTAAPAGSGTSASPYNSIATALNAARAGDVVRLMAGIYYTAVDFPRGGTSANPITLTSDGAARSAIIDCQNRNVNCLTIDQSNVTVDGLTVRNAAYNGIKVDGDVNGTVTSGSYGNWAGYGTRLNRVNGADNITIKNSLVQNIGMDCVKIGHMNYLYLINNEILTCGTAGQQQGVDLVGVYNAVIRGNFIHDDGAVRSMDVGLFAKGGSENILIENNIIQNIVSPYAGLEIGGDTEWYNTRYTPSNFSYDLNAVLLGQTTASNNIDNPDTYQGRFMAECRNAVVRGNIIITADPPISLRNAYNTQIYNNTVIDSGWSQKWVKFWDDGNHYHPVEQTKIYNNVFSNKTVALSMGRVYQDKSLGAPYPSNLVGAVSDNNAYYNMGGTVDRNLTGQDANSKVLDPQLDANHIPMPRSPLIDAGVNLNTLGIITASDVHVDRNNVARPTFRAYDIGAMEYNILPGGKPY